MIIKSFQCDTLKRHYHLISSTHVGYLAGFKVACDAYASSGTVADLNAMIAAYMSYYALYSSIVSPTTHDSYAANDAANVISTTGAQIEWKAPAYQLCVWTNPAADGLILWKSGESGESFTDSTNYPLTSLQKDKIGCMEAVDSVNDGIQIHKVPFAVDCGTYNRENLIDDKETGTSLCEFVVFQNLDFIY